MGMLLESIHKGAVRLLFLVIGDRYSIIECCVGDGSFWSLIFC